MKSLAMIKTKLIILLLPDNSDVEVSGECADLAAMY